MDAANSASGSAYNRMMGSYNYNSWHGHTNGVDEVDGWGYFSRKGKWQKSLRSYRGEYGR